MKVFLCETIHPAALQKLRSRAEIIDSWQWADECDALIDRNFHIGAEELDRMPSLKVIAVHGTGTNDLDLAEIRRRRIQVVYAPHLNANAVAEMTVALLLALCRKLVTARKCIDAETTAESMGLLSGTELRGKTAAFLGTGAIATRTAEILKNGFEMKIAACSPHFTPEEAEKRGWQYCADLPELLKKADVLSLNLPLTDATRGIISADALSMMKKSAVLVNTSRGALVDENALFTALKEKKIAGAASDVFCSEPPKPQDALLSLPNFVATPHLGANTDEALLSVGMACVDQIFDVLDGKEPKYPVK